MSWCYPGGLQILTGHQLMVKLSTWCHLDKRGPKTALSTMSLIKNSPTCPGLQYIHLLEFLGSKSSPDFLHQLLDVDLYIVERLLNSRSGGDPVVNPGMSGRFPRCGHFSRSLHYVEKERGPSLTSLFLQFCPPLLTHCPLALILFSMEGTVIQPPLLCRTCPPPRALTTRLQIECSAE